MDLLCDNIVEEVLRRLPAKYLHRVRAVSRRYNDLVLSPGFVARYWQSHSPHLAGVFLQTESLIRPWGHFPDFLAGSPGTSATKSIFSSDLGFLPHHLPESQLPREITGDAKKIFIVHSTAGLLLCSKGQNNVVQYYVCNPVSWQWASLPELPWRSYCLYGLLSVSDNGDGIIRSFQVFLFNNPTRWNETGGCLDLKVFSSDTGQWKRTRIQPPPHLDVDGCLSPFLGQSGTAYWTGHRVKDKVIAYNCDLYSIQVLPLPDSVPDSTNNRCIGERQDGSLRYAHIDHSVFEVWDLRREGENGMSWMLVHQVGVMELAQRNLEVATRAARFFSSTIQGFINTNSLFPLLGFHPTEDIIYMDASHTVVAYSMEQGTMRYESPRQCLRMDMFSYVHPAHPVQIPAIKEAPLE